VAVSAKGRDPITLIGYARMWGVRRERRNTTSVPSKPDPSSSTELGMGTGVTLISNEYDPPSLYVELPFEASVTGASS
jgi:hypothetical protein